MQQQLKRLQNTIAESTAIDGVILDEELHGDVSQMMKEYTKDILLMKRELFSICFGSSKTQLIH